MTKLRNRENSPSWESNQFSIFFFLGRLLKIDEKLNSVTTVEKMKAMFNNYELDTAINEYVSPMERKEEDEFLEAVLATPVMRLAKCHKTRLKR